MSEKILQGKTSSRNQTKLIWHVRPGFWRRLIWGEGGGGANTAMYGENGESNVYQLTENSSSKVLWIKN